jgi:hypothetical protein
VYTPSRNYRDDLGIILEQSVPLGESETLLVELHVAFRAADLLEQHVTYDQIYD